MTTDQAMNQGLYQRMHNGVEVPYPWLHPILSQEANKSKTLRTPSKRKPTDQADSQPTPKRPASALDEKTGTSIPRHIGGLLSAVAPDEPASQPPSPSPVDGNGDAATPPANEPAAGGRGRKRKLQAARSPSADGDESEAEENELVPPIPNGAAEPDEHGVRLINKRARVNDMPNNRIMVPPLFEFESHEIGFRDSTNDKSRGATKAKRRKFLNQPDSGAMFFDRNLCGYDATQYADGDLDQDTVKKHSLHPKYGLFLQNSANDAEVPRPFQNGWKPTVFVTEDGKVQHTSRSIAKSKAEGSYVKNRLSFMMKEFMIQEGMTDEDLRDEETDRLLKEREAKRVALQQQEAEQEAEQDQQLFTTNIHTLLAAASAVESQAEQGAQALPEARSVSPALSRPSTMSRPYDAVRDVFGGSDLPSIAATPPAPIDNSGAANLMFLADIALQDAQLNGVPPTPVPDAPVEQQIPIQMPEPVRPKRLRDPSDLEQGEGALMIQDYPDPQHEPQPRRLAMPEHFMSHEQVYGVQSTHLYHDRTVPESPLARPESFNYREQPMMTYEQMKQPLQPPLPFPGQQGPQIHGTAEPYGYGEAEMAPEPPRLRRPSQTGQPEDQYGPLVPNTQDVALLDPQLFEGGQRPPPSQLQAPQPEQKAQAQRSGSVLQQPHTSFFQTALNSPSTPTPVDQSHPPEYNEPSQAYQQSAQHMNGQSRSHLINEGSPGRTPFSNPNGIETQPLPPLRPLHRGSGPLMPPTAQGPQTPQHIMMTGGEVAEPYPPPPHTYTDQGYPPNGFGPDQPIMSTEQGLRAGSISHQIMHPSQPPPSAYPAQQSYPNPGPTGPQGPPQYENPPTGQILQSPPPFANHAQGISPSPSRRSGSISSRSNNNKQYREIKPAPRQAEAYDTNGSELRTLLYNPYEGIRDYHATAPPPSHGPTQIRGWTHSTGSKRTRGAKGSTDSQADPSLARDEKK